MKKNIKCKILLIYFLCMWLPIVSMANQELIVPQYTEEYKMWSELSDEEKKDYIEPQAYEVILPNSENEIQLSSVEVDTNEVSATALPPKWQMSYYGDVKNQGYTNGCWGYSAATVFDTNYYITNSKKKQFSNLHMDYITSRNYNKDGFNRAINSGGNMQIALAYATNGMGIALESNMPSEENRTSTTIKNVSTDSKVRDYVQLTDRSEIKNHIYKYGAVSAYTYIAEDNSYFSSNTLYNNNDLAYCCTYQDVLAGSLKANHAITLIGWDDNYTNTVFPGKIGAYIVLNSYGSNFGANGLYYIFYDDYFLSNSLLGVRRTDDIDYDYIYQHDTYGCTGTGGYTDITYAANVFTRKSTNTTEKLKEISIYVPQKGSVTVYINPNNKDVKTSSATKTLTTYIYEPGYHTIELDNPIELKNKQFAIGVKCSGAIGIEVPTSTGWCATATSNSGESYMSLNGVDYEEMQTIYSQYGYNYVNACIKAFTVKGSSTTTTSNTNNVSKNEYKADLINYVFDYKYYADHNLDLYNAYGYNKSALQNHWNKYGKAEGRASSSILNLKYYVENNGDLAIFKNNYVAAYNHFMNYGYAEYRKSSIEYDGNFYKKNNGDLKNMTSMQLIRHYSLYGKNELRKANNNYDIANFLFDAEIYAEFNPDVAYAYGNNTNMMKMHWYKYGISEGRIASLVFDARYYLKNNKDVAKAYSATNYAAAYSHFLTYGFAEGRQGNAIFSVKYYLSNNGDIKKTYGNNYLRVLNHFVNYGKSEPRITSSKFSVTVYRLKNVDIRRAYGENYYKYYKHYLKYGQNEKRVCK